MAYARKTHDEWCVEGNYEGAWYLECNCEDAVDAKRTIREYRENCPGTAFRIKKHRVPNEQKGA